MGGKAKGRPRQGLGPKGLATVPPVPLLQAHPLAAGRKLRILPGSETTNEHLEILSPSGQVEVEIVLTAEGPLVRVNGGALRLTSTRSINLEAAGPVHIDAQELRVRTKRSVHLNGETIRLNCDENGNPESSNTQPLPSPPSV